MRAHGTGRVASRRRSADAHQYEHHGVERLPQSRDTTNDSSASSLEKLSSGYRINRAADDASGLVISENLEVKQVSGLQQATRTPRTASRSCRPQKVRCPQVNSMLQRIRDLVDPVGEHRVVGLDGPAGRAERDRRSSATRSTASANTTSFGNAEPARRQLRRPGGHASPATRPAARAASRSATRPRPRSRSYVDSGAGGEPLGDVDGHRGHLRDRGVVPDRAPERHRRARSPATPASPARSPSTCATSAAASGRSSSSATAPTTGAEARRPPRSAPSIAGRHRERQRRRSQHGGGVFQVGANVTANEPDHVVDQRHADHRRHQRCVHRARRGIDVTNTTHLRQRADAGRRRDRRRCRHSWSARCGPEPVPVDDLEPAGDHAEPLGIREPHP